MHPSSPYAFAALLGHGERNQRQYHQQHHQQQ
jgi:hypothetical protein